MNEECIIFGDVHLNWKAVVLILDYARKNCIETVLTLGDEAHKKYPYLTGEQEDYDRIWHEFRVYKKENPNRKLILTVGDKTAGVAKDMFKYFIGVDAKTGKITGSTIYKEDNVIVGHDGQSIMDKYGPLIDQYDGLEPLVIFHGHSHSMGVLPEYKWLNDDEFVGWLKNGEEHHILKPGMVYWVNPGGQFLKTDDNKMAANFAKYNPKNHSVTLETIFYKEEEIHPSPRIK